MNANLKILLNAQEENPPKNTIQHKSTNLDMDTIENILDDFLACLKTKETRDDGCGGDNDMEEEEENDDDDATTDTENENQPNQWIASLSIDQIIEIENHIYEMIDDYIQTEIHTMSAPKFHENMIADISILLHPMLVESNLYNCSEDDLAEVEILVENICKSFFQTNAITIPPRSHLHSFPKQLSNNEIENLTIKIETLRNVYQPKQRTNEWYAFRHNLITASNIWKIFGTQSSQNSIIYEKCRPFVSADTNVSGISSQNHSVNTNSTLHHGVKYEPLSIKIYENKYETKIEDFGCIQHSKYPFIGASPDGINILPESGRFGRMIEVKNISNRDIDSIPKMEYWIQMQIQMETCDLDDCDFIETRFKEYENDDQFYHTEVKMINGEMEIPEYKGIILYFVERLNPVPVPCVVKRSFSAESTLPDAPPETDIKIVHMNNYMGDDDDTNTLPVLPVSITKNQPHYVYMEPIHHTDSVKSSREYIEEWIAQQKKELSANYILYETIYWYLDEFSCVLVERTKEWFDAVLPKIKDTWATIERERVEGYEHRKPLLKKKL
jgi:putative phage-type endonuclease